MHTLHEGSYIVKQEERKRDGINKNRNREHERETAEK